MDKTSSVVVATFGFSLLRHRLTNLTSFVTNPTTKFGKNWFSDDADDAGKSAYTTTMSTPTPWKLVDSMCAMRALISIDIRSLREVCCYHFANLLALSSLSVPHFAVEPIRLW